MDYLTADEFSWSASSALKPIQMAFHGYAEPERVLVGAHGLGDSAEDGPYLRFGTERVTKTWLRLPKDRTFDFCEPAFVAGSDTETSWRRCDLSPSSHYNHKWAGGRGFTTGPNPTGYTITGLGVDIDLQSGTLDPTANIYAANAFHTAAGALDPQSPLAGYRATAGAGRSPDRFAPRTSASAELQADPERAYVAYFRNAPGGYFQTPNAAGGQDPGAEAGWTLGRSYGSRFVRPLGFGGDDWNFGEGDARLVPLNVYGWPNPLPPAPNPDPPAPAPALVSNLGKASNASGFAVARTTVLDREIASSFTTGEHNAGYALHGLQIEVPSDPADFVGGLRAAIHADDGGQPGRRRCSSWVCRSTRGLVCSRSMPRTASSSSRRQPSGWSSTLRLRPLMTIQSMSPTPGRRARTTARPGTGRLEPAPFGGLRRAALGGGNFQPAQDGRSRRAGVQRNGRDRRARLRRPARRHHYHRARDRRRRRREGPAPHK